MRAGPSPTPVASSRHARALFGGFAACLACAAPALGASTGFGGALELVFENDAQVSIPVAPAATALTALQLWRHGR